MTKAAKMVHLLCKPVKQKPVADVFKLQTKPCEDCGGLEKVHIQRVIFFLTDCVKVRCKKCNRVITFPKLYSSQPAVEKVIASAVYKVKPMAAWAKMLDAVKIKKGKKNAKVLQKKGSKTRTR